MSSPKPVFRWCALLVLVAWPAGAAATLPDDLAVEYYLHETPGDPQSDVVYTFRLFLTAVDQDGDEIAWDIQRLDIVQLGENATDLVWTDQEASFASGDGHWWIEHADPQQPDTAEFDLPPLLTGSAAAEDPGDPDLDYTLQGVPCTATCPALYSGYSAALNYDLYWFPESPMWPIEESEDDVVVEVSEESLDW